MPPNVEEEIRFCENCGRPQTGSNFCGRCGAQLKNQIGHHETYSSEIQNGSPPSFESPTRRTQSKTIFIAIAAIAVTIATVTTFWFIRSKQSGYQNSAKNLFAVVTNDNLIIDGKIRSLIPGTDPTAVLSSVNKAIADCDEVSGAISSLGNSNAALELKLREALTAEKSWLRTVQQTLSHPLVPTPIALAEARATAVEAFNGLEILGSVVFAPTHNVTNWAAALRQDHQFVIATQSILSESATILPTLTYFFSQLNAAATNGPVSITLSEAEADIQRIIDSRERMQLRSQLLTSYDPTTANIRQLLTNAFRASLKDDYSLSNCLYENNNGWTAYIAKSCLDVSLADSIAATKAKSSFTIEYNKLRKLLGLTLFSGTF